MNPFELLGIPGDADITAIKRAYARLLRQHRPDEDPVGFQRVHEAYQACLAHAQRALHRQQLQAIQAQREVEEKEEERAEPAQAPVSASVDGIEPAMQAPVVETDSPLQPAPVPDEPEVQIPPEPVRAVEPPAGIDAPLDQPAPSPVSPSQPGVPDPARRPVAKPLPVVRIAAPARAVGLVRPIEFSLSDFVRDLCQRDQDGQAALGTWLQRCEPLYALGLKHAITAPLLQLLLQHTEPLSPNGLRVVFEFFGLDTVSPERRALEGLITALENRTRAAWAIRQYSPPAPAGKGKKYSNRIQVRLDRLAAQEFLKPFSLPRRATILLIPGFKVRMRHMLAQIPTAIDQSKDPMFNQDALKFWRQALDASRLSRWRILSMGVNVSTIMLLFAMLDDEWSASVMAAYLLVGTLMLSGWLALAANDARKVRLARGGSPPGRLDLLVAREFRKPPNRYRRAAFLLVPGFKPGMRRVLGRFPPGSERMLDPTFDTDALKFWRDALDPMRVGKWRILSSLANAAWIVLLVGLITQDATITAQYGFLALLLFVGWFALAVINANTLRKNRSAGPETLRKRSFSLFQSGSGISRRWIIWIIIIALNAIVRSMFSQ